MNSTEDSCLRRSIKKLKLDIDDIRNKHRAGFYLFLQQITFFIMRKSRLKKRHQRPGCVLCKNKMCIDEKPPRIICRIYPEMTSYSGCITRSMAKLLDSTNDFIIYETYRCMPLLGDENENVPDWDIHIVRYTLVFNKINH